jgi:hypothetical protein
MVDPTSFLPGLSPVAGKAVVARFDGGRLSSEGGLLALREVERRLGLAGRLAGALIDQYCASFRHVPKRIVLDIDDTFDRVHGGHPLRLFNAVHNDCGFQPIVVFDGEGRFMTALLRPGQRPSGKEARALRRRLIGALRARWPRVPSVSSCTFNTCILLVHRSG